MEEQNQPLPCPIADESALMNIRAMLNLALNGYEEAMRGKARHGPALDLTSTMHTAVEYLDDLLGITKPADESEQMPADYWHGEMKAEIEAERQADAAYELAAELASCDWEGWN